MSMTVRFWGVRGSIASPGPDTVKVGGNTSCVEITAGASRLVLDAGTGLSELTPRMALFIGLSLGLLGGGGSILTLPILVYVLHQDPKEAIAASLFVALSVIPSRLPFAIDDRPCG